MTAIQAELLSYLPFKRKQSSSGWLSFDAPCCVHNGESSDNRQRGGFIGHATGGFSYHCFNCNFKTSWQPGRTLSVKTKKFFKWLNVPESKINEWALEALKELDNSNSSKFQIKEFVETPLPLESIPLTDALLEFPESIACLDYILNRGMDLDTYNWHYSPTPGFKDRLVIPFYHAKKLVGYTARKVTNGKPKYLSEAQTGYVFNIDNQNYKKKFVFVTEGPFDALSIDGIGILTNIPNDQQRAIINSLGKTVVVVPDRDYPGMAFVKYAMDNEWLVAIPNWEDDIKDVSEAMTRYGKLFTIKNLIDTATDNKIKLELLIKKYPKEKKDDNN
jgi:hypothetical protein